ncbi:HAD family phosphatase [Candidatus Bathyarchaeota archaeon]|nr:HAD family phosphatase [Candidatus Bathyarchaeota archaeon]
MFDMVIFDWDGTLADTQEVIVLAFQKVLRKVGCEVSDEFLKRRIGIGAKNMFREALEIAKIRYDEEMINRLLEEKTKIHLMLTPKIKLFDGVTDLLEALRPFVKLALATMSNREVIEKTLREKGIKSYFDFVITADEVEKPKPDPEAFLKCAEAMRCKPEKCVVIEDSVFGVIAARRAGMKCIAIPSGFYSKSDLEKEKPDLIVDSIKEKNTILTYILGKEKPL